MRFWIPIIIACVSTSLPAEACLLSQDHPTASDIRHLRAIDKQIAHQDELKSYIDVSVWGVFLDDPVQSLHQNGFTRFQIGGINKGDPDDVIRVVSNRRDIEVGTKVYALNLREIDRHRWSDVGVPQEQLNWGPEACHRSTNSARCQIFLTRQSPVKDLCHSVFLEVYTGCFYREELPKVCLQYETSARQKWAITQR